MPREVTASTRRERKLFSLVFLDAKVLVAARCERKRDRDGGSLFTGWLSRRVSSRPNLSGLSDDDVVAVHMDVHFLTAKMSPTAVLLIPARFESDLNRLLSGCAESRLRAAFSNMHAVYPVEKGRVTLRCTRYHSSPHSVRPFRLSLTGNNGPIASR